MKITLIQKNGKPTWRLSRSEGGIEIRRFFKTEAEAQAELAKFAKEPSDLDGQWMRLPLKTKIDLFSALEAAQSEGERLPALLHKWREIVLKANQVTVESKPQSVTLRHALGGMMAFKRAQGLRPRSLQALESTVQRFVTNRDTVLCDAVTSEEISAWLTENDWQPATRKTYRIDLCTFFSYAIGQGWATVNPVAKVATPILEDKPVEIIKVDEVKKIFTVCQDRDPHLIHYFVLGFFCGIRPEEIIRLDAEDVSLEHRQVEVAAHKSKTRQRRLVDIPDNAMAWLERWHELPVTTAIKRRNKIRVRAAVPWPHDCMRHCFGSYHLALSGSADKTAYQMGHRSTEMLIKHYRDLVRTPAAKAYFSIVPL